MLHLAACVGASVLLVVLGSQVAVGVGIHVTNDPAPFIAAVVLLLSEIIHRQAGTGDNTPQIIGATGGNNHAGPGWLPHPSSSRNQGYKQSNGAVGLNPARLGISMSGCIALGRNAFGFTRSAGFSIAWAQHAWGPVCLGWTARSIGCSWFPIAHSGFCGRSQSSRLPGTTWNNGWAVGERFSILDASWGLRSRSFRSRCCHS